MTNHFKTLELTYTAWTPPFPPCSVQSFRGFLPVRPRELYPPSSIHTKSLQSMRGCAKYQTRKGQTPKSSTEHFILWLYILQRVIQCLKIYCIKLFFFLFLHTLLHKPSYFSQIALCKSLYTMASANNMEELRMEYISSLCSSQLLSSITILPANIAGAQLLLLAAHSWFLEDKRKNMTGYVQDFRFWSCCRMC